MSQIQQRNDQMVDLLSADFQRRYEPNFAWKSAVSQFQYLLGLRGFWPMSSADDTGAAYDLSGQGRTLTYNGNPYYRAIGLQTFIQFDGTGDYLERADEAGLDIAGTETFIYNAQRGLTVGAWVYPEETTTLESIHTKWGAAAQRSWLLQLSAADLFEFYVSDDGTNSDVAQSAAVSMDAWYFVVGRFYPGASVDLFVNGVWTTQATARLSVFNSNTALNIGARAGGTEPFQGRVALAFLSAAALDDVVVWSLWQQSRAMFGV